MATSSETVIWIMDSDLCPNCDALLEYPDQCIECGYGWLWIDDVGYEEEFGNGEDEEDDLYTDFGDYDEKRYFMGEYDEEENELVH